MKLDLNGYAFEKSYLISYVIRNLRYPLISNKKPFKYLFANRFFIKKNMNVKLIIINKNKRTEKMIVKNGISKYGFIAKHISFAPFYLSGLSNENYQSIRKFLVEEYNSPNYPIYPPVHDIFNALKYTSYEDVKVLLLGQDPYHGPNQAHGLCFSVQKGVEKAKCRIRP